MSSSNLVRIAFIEETTLGETPGSGNFTTARFISESLSGTPTTTESQQIRTDRMSSGQVAVGLEVGGDINFELAKEAALDNLIEGAMLNDFDVQASQSVDLEIDASAKTIERASGDFNATLEVGDIITLAGFTNTVNNTQAQVVEIVSALIIRVVFNETNGLVVNEVGSGTSYQRADKLVIGTTKKSFSMEKTFLDLTNKAINYRGMVANNMTLNISYGEIINGTVGFNGTDYEPVSAAIDFMTDGRTINASATSNSMNGSIDMPFINTSDSGTFDEASFCIQSVNLNLTNNYQAQTCIGEAAPKDYSPGQASIEVSISAYLADANWSALAKKLSQEAFGIGFMVKNSGGFYGFYLPQVQVSFPDPASAGANQQISLEMEGTAKVGASGESALVIYRG
jgi:hypothetical protein